MAYFLFKTEPDVYSFDDFLRDQETVWDNVTNPTAVKYLREMKAGTKWIFYHTGGVRTAVGTGTGLRMQPLTTVGEVAGPALAAPRNGALRFPAPEQGSSMVFGLYPALETC